MKVPNKKDYFLNVWVTVVLGAPVLILVYLITYDFPAINFDIRYLGFPFILIPVSILYLFPSLFIYYLALKTFANKDIPVIHIKILTTFIGVISLLPTYFLFVGKGSPFFFGLDLRVFPISYALVFVGASIVFKLRENAG